MTTIQADLAIVGAGIAGLTEAKLTSISEDERGAARPFPVQVDGDYLGDFTDFDLRIEPGALTLVA